MLPMVHILHLMVYTTSLPLRDSFTTACLILDSGLSGHHNPNTVLRQDEGANDYRAVLGLPTETQQRGGLELSRQREKPSMRGKEEGIRNKADGMW